jgi:hypothetical protein
MGSLPLLLPLLLLPSLAAPATTDLIWSTANTQFRAAGLPLGLEILVNSDNAAAGPGEFDQLQLRCPADVAEEHVIYRVSRAEYLSCRVAGPRPEVVMVCSAARPDHRLRTITFRPYSPSPGGLEFPAGSSHYFLSTAAPGRLRAREGGACRTHNLRLAVRVAAEAARLGDHPPRPEQLPPRLRVVEEPRGPSLYTGRRPAVPSSQYLYYYSPRDLLRLATKARSLRPGGPAAEAAAIVGSGVTGLAPPGLLLLLLTLLATAH